MITSTSSVQGHLVGTLEIDGLCRGMSVMPGCAIEDRYLPMMLSSEVGQLVL